MDFNDLKQRIHSTPISSIIGGYLNIVQRGSQKLAICPFHDDKHPSLNINDSRNMFYCFVDRIGGDAINFVRLYKKLEFVDALKDICQTMGWDFNEYVNDNKDPKYKMGLYILKKATQLYRSWATEKKCKEYNNFILKRGLSHKIASDYSLGFASDTYPLSTYLQSIEDIKKKNYSLKIAEEIGILKKRSSKYRDIFFNRIMFPIENHFGQVIGFTSRSLSDGQKPKYMNSIDSFLFNKKDILYGFCTAKCSIKEHNAVILVEGNMDQITLNKYGFINSVAVMGLALGDKSKERILNLTKNIYLAMDNDEAGIKAMDKINNQLLKDGIIPKFIDLKPHKDPDDFLEKEGADKFKERMTSAKAFLDIQLENIFPKSIPQLTDAKLETLRLIYKVLAPLGNCLASKERLLQWASKLEIKVNAEAIIEDYLKFISTAIVDSEVVSSDKSLKSHRVSLEEVLTKAEKRLIKDLVLHPELLNYAYKRRKELSCLLDIVEHNEVKTLIQKLSVAIFEISDKEYDNFLLDMLSSEEFSPELGAYVSSLVANRIEIIMEPKEVERAFDQLKSSLRKEIMKQKMNILRKKQKNATNKKEVENILNEMSDLGI